MPRSKKRESGPAARLGVAHTPAADLVLQLQQPRMPVAGAVIGLLASRQEAHHSKMILVKRLDAVGPHPDVEIEMTRSETPIGVATGLLHDLNGQQMSQRIHTTPENQSGTAAATGIRVGHGVAPPGDVGQGADLHGGVREGGLEVPHGLVDVTITALLTEDQGRLVGGAHIDPIEETDLDLHDGDAQDLTRGQGGAPSPEPDQNLAPDQERESVLHLCEGGREAQTGESSEPAPNPARVSYDRPPTLTRMKRKSGSKSRYGSGRKRPRRTSQPRKKRAPRACPCQGSTLSPAGIALSGATAVSALRK